MFLFMVCTQSIVVIIIILFILSAVASAIVNSDHWEKAMVWQDATGKSTPMKLLIRSMPGTINFTLYSETLLIGPLLAPSLINENPH